MSRSGAPSAGPGCACGRSMAWPSSGIRITAASQDTSSEIADTWKIERVYSPVFERARAIEPTFADAVMSLRNEPNVVDIRTVGLTAGIDLAPLPDAPGKRGFASLDSAFHDNDLMLRIAGDTLVLTPPLIVSEDQIGEIVEKVKKVIHAVA